MDTATKDAAKLSAGLSAAVIGVFAVLFLVTPSVKTITMEWDYPAADLPDAIFEFVSKTNLNSPWRFKAHVTNATRVTFTATNGQEFFTISKVMSVWDTNLCIKQKGF